MRTTRKIQFSAAKAENVPVATFVEHSLSLLQIQKSLSYFFLILAVRRLLQFFMIYFFSAKPIECCCVCRQGQTCFKKREREREMRERESERE